MLWLYSDVKFIVITNAVHALLNLLPMSVTLTVSSQRDAEDVVDKQNYDVDRTVIGGQKQFNTPATGDNGDGTGERIMRSTQQNAMQDKIAIVQFPLAKVR